MSKQICLNYVAAGAHCRADVAGSQCCRIAWGACVGRRTLRMTKGRREDHERRRQAGGKHDALG